MLDAKDILLRAVEISLAEARVAYLEAAFVDQPGIRGKAEALLAEHDDPESFLERPAALVAGLTYRATPLGWLIAIVMGLSHAY